MFPLQDKTVLNRKHVAMTTFGRTSSLRSQVSLWATSRALSRQFTKSTKITPQEQAKTENSNESSITEPKDLHLKGLYEELFGEDEGRDQRIFENFTPNVELSFDDFATSVMPEDKENIPPLSLAIAKSSSLPLQSIRNKGTFTPFPKLPIELRTIIWNLSLPASRVVEINRTRHADNSSPDYRSPAIIPVALHVCSEPRTIAQKQYSLSFGPSIWENAGKIWFNKDIDVIFFNCRRLTHHSEITRFLMWVCDIDKIQHLAICGAACESLVTSLADNEVLAERLKKNMKVKSLACTSHGTSFSRKNLRIGDLRTPIEFISPAVGQLIERMLGAKIKYGMTKSGRW